MWLLATSPQRQLRAGLTRKRTGVRRVWLPLIVAVAAVTFGLWANSPHASAEEVTPSASPTSSDATGPATPSDSSSSSLPAPDPSPSSSVLPSASSVLGCDTGTEPVCPYTWTVADMQGLSAAVGLSVFALVAGVVGSWGRS